MICTILPPRLNNIPVRYNFMCGCEGCIYSKVLHSFLLIWCDRYLKKLKIKLIMRKTEIWVKWKVVFLKPIIVMWGHMVTISQKWHQTWPWQKCFPFRLINILCLAVNLNYHVVKNFQVLSYPVKNQTRMTQTRVLQWVFMHK